MKEIGREFLLSLWKIQILHDAAKGPVVGQWILREVRQYGYDVSPGTIYPLLKRMEQRGWLRCDVDPKGGARGRRYYYLTEKGGQVLDFILRYIGEMCQQKGMLARGGKARVASLSQRTSARGRRNTRRTSTRGPAS